MTIREPWPVARTRQRRREFAAVFAGVPRESLGDGLEIGAGDGFLASMLAPYCRSFIATDSYRARLAIGAAVAAAAAAAAPDGPGVATGAPPPRRMVCDVTHLPFGAATFDFIFSSSVLEHVRDRQAAFAEMYRLLRPGGLMLHIMPSRTWKLLQLFFYYPHLLLGAADLALERVSRTPPLLPAATTSPSAPSAVGERWSDARNWRLSLRTILRGAIPRVHGEFAGHVSEWRGFGMGPWMKEFQAAGFEVDRVLRLPLYSGYGFGLDRLRAWGEKRGLSSHHAFVVTKKSDAVSCPALRWFNDGKAPPPGLAAGSAT